MNSPSEVLRPQIEAALDRALGDAVDVSSLEMDPKEFGIVTSREEFYRRPTPPPARGTWTGVGSTTTDPPEENMRTAFTPDLQEALLDKVRSGMSIKDATKAIGIGATAPYTAKVPGFRDRLDKAIRERTGETPSAPRPKKTRRTSSESNGTGDRTNLEALIKQLTEERDKLNVTISVLETRLYP